MIRGWEEIIMMTEWEIDSKHVPLCMPHLLSSFTGRCRTRTNGRSCACGDENNVSVIFVPADGISNLAIIELRVYALIIEIW